jgi:hypothetical protein
MPAATTSANGHLTSTDWNTFNGKQGSITLTTTGTSGAATLVGTTLNIPQYSGGGSGDVTGPASSVNNTIAVFDGTTGKVLKNTAPTLAAANIFVGNGSSLSTAVAMSGDVTIDNAGATTVGTINSVAVATVTAGAAAGATANQDSTGTILGGNLTGTVNSVAVATVTSGAALGATAQQPPSEGAFVNGDKTKLDAIEASADVTDTANVTSAGALMDSEVTNLAQVKAFSSADYATAAQGALADSAQQPPSEGAFVNGDKTKLDAIEASADVTDAANVTAAGALMDSEVTNLAQVKAFDSSDYATAAQGTTADAALPKAGGAMTGAITGNQEITGRRPIVSDTNTTINLTLGTHEGVFLYSDNASAVTVNVPTNASQAFPVGTEIDIIQAGAGTVGLVPASGVNLNGANTSIPITAQWGAVTIKQIVADNWIVVGKI